MHRFHLPPEQCRARSLTLAGAEAHHASRVLRIRPGETVVVLDGAGRELTCAVTDLQRSTVALQVTRDRFVPPLPYSITLLLAIPKGKLIESVIQKATELGVTRVVPLCTERVIAQLDAASAVEKGGKWQAIAVEAIKQSGNAWLPKVEPPMAFNAYLARAEPFDLSLIGSLQEERRHPRAWIEAFIEQHGKTPRTVAVWIGPEGDFTPAEVRAAREAGALPITLGRLVLRVETAATYCLSVLNYELQWRAPDHGDAAESAAPEE